MKNNFKQNERQQIEERAKRKLQQMSVDEREEYVLKEKKLMYLWLGINLCSCIVSLPTIILCLIIPDGVYKYPIGAAILLMVVGIAGAIFMAVKLRKNNEEIALERIKREVKKEVKIEMERQKIQMVVGEDFVISKIVPILANRSAKLIVDNENKRFVYYSRNFQSKTYSFLDIINYEVYENGNSKVQGRAGAALIGGAFFGLGGFIVGSSMSRNINEKCNDLKLIIRLNDLNNPQITITYIERAELDKNDRRYRNIKENMQSICSILEYMINERTLEQSVIIHQEKICEEKPSKEQLRELKEMLDEGLITQEDFEQKKKQILGL